MHGTDALLTAVWAIGGGLLAQLLAHRVRVPAILPLLAIGVLVGPSVLSIVQPAVLGDGLPVIVKLAVAVILFDGALNLRLGDLRHAIAEVRNLVTIGVVVTWAGAILAARYIAELSWPVAIVFGAGILRKISQRPATRRTETVSRLRRIVNPSTVPPAATTKVPFVV